ncbi:MAG: NAD(P)-dependent oxidoreductase [Betaproteobacteria bacterium]|nr:NAD(P)-dependent oxidoreductase [Betaproteobacteria bacterium]
MNAEKAKQPRLGWIGTGRMGFDMSRRLAKAGCDLTVWNRTRAKAEPLVKDGAKIADKLADLAGCDIVFVMVSTWNDVKEVISGPQGLLSEAKGGGGAPRIVVECSPLSIEASIELRQALAACGTQLLAAPSSGGAPIIRAGKLAFVVSGPKEAYDAAAPYFAMIGQVAAYAGEGELARIVKICHNVLLAVVTQSMAEVTVLAEKAGVPRHAFLDFLNKSVMGSTFTRYKTPAFVNLDMTITIPPSFLRKDVELGLEAGRKLEVPMPLASITRDLIQSTIGLGMNAQDFAVLLVQQARASGIELKPENVPVTDGLS